jgi:hypothetical protein
VAAALAVDPEIDAGVEQLGARFDELTKDLGGVAGEVYRNAFGSSLEEVGPIVSAVAAGLGRFTDGSAAGIQNLTEKTFTLSDVLGVDILESLGAAPWPPRPRSARGGRPGAWPTPRFRRVIVARAGAMSGRSSVQVPCAAVRVATAPAALEPHQGHG